MDQPSTSTAAPLPPTTTTTTVAPSTKVFTLANAMRVLAGMALAIAAYRTYHTPSYEGLLVGALAVWILWPSTSDEGRTRITVINRAAPRPPAPPTPPGADHTTATDAENETWVMAYQEGLVEVQNQRDETVVSNEELAGILGIEDPDDLKASELNAMLRLAQRLADQHNADLGYDTRTRI